MLGIEKSRWSGKAIDENSDFIIDFHSPPDDPTLRLSIPVSSSDISMSIVSISSGPFIPLEGSLFMLVMRLNLGGMDGVGRSGGL